MSEPDTADHALITAYLTGELSLEDRERFDERLRTDPQFRELAEPLINFWRIARPLDPKADPNPAETERAVAELKRRLELERLSIQSPALEQKRAKRRSRLRILFTFILAIISAGLYEWLRLKGMPLVIHSLLVHTDAPAYKKRNARLPDETQVTLLPGSHLSYSRAFSSSLERTLNLDGEGTFVVAPGRVRLWSTATVSRS